MAIIKSVRGFSPQIGANCFLAETATIIGDVKIGDDCSIWYNAVLRGDVNSIRNFKECEVDIFTLFSGLRSFLPVNGNGDLV